MTQTSPLTGTGDALLRHLAGVVSAQQAEIVELRSELAELRSALRSSHRDLATELATSFRNADERCGSLEKELSHANQAIRSLELSALEAAHLGAEKLKSLEKLSTHQIDINAQRVADTAYLQERLNALMQQKSAATAGDAAGSSPPAGVGELAHQVKRLQQQFDDLLAVFEIPNTYTKSEGRPVTTQSIEILATQPRARRVRFLHSLPCFHVLWTELFRIAQERRVPYTARTSDRSAEVDLSGGGGEHFSAVGSPKQQASPVRAVVETGRLHPSGIVAIPGLGVDVISMEGQRGVVLFRIVRGGALDGAGCVEGDTIVAIGDIAVVGCFHLADLVEEAQRLRTPRLLLSVIPAGRSTAMPLNIRLGFQ